MEGSDGDPGALHGRELGEVVHPSVWVLRATSPALVLGSTQRDPAIVERAGAAGLDVVRRRSGGGAVMVVPGELVWIDVIVPAGDRRWDADVGRSFHWLGEVWCDALATLGVEGRVHRGAMITSDLSPTVCFAGLGPGEVFVGNRKVVGISQRRVRTAARFQSAALLGWDPAPYVEVLFGGDPAVASQLALVAAGLERAPDEVEAAFLAQLATR